MACPQPRRTSIPRPAARSARILGSYRCGAADRRRSQRRHRTDTQGHRVRWREGNLRARDEIAADDHPEAPEKTMSRSAEAARQRERANRLAIERAKHGERKSP